MRQLDLDGNAITDISAFAVAAWLDFECMEIYLVGNPLDAASIDVTIPALCAKGAAVAFADEICNAQCVPQP